MNLPSVTSIIGFCNQGAFDGIPEAIMQRAAARGTDVHDIAALHLQGLFYEVDPAFEGYHKSLVDWTDRYVLKVIFVEKELVDLNKGFKGHPDTLLLLREDKGLTLMDWKTPKPLSKSWRLQLAGYKLLCEANGYQVSRVASLRLDKDGGQAKFQGYSKTMAADKNVFLSCLNVWKFFNG